MNVAEELLSVDAHTLLDVAMEMGGDWHTLTKGLPVADQGVIEKQAIKNPEDYVRLLQNVAASFHDTHIGIRWGMRASLNVRGRLGLAVMSARTVADVVQIYNAYQPLLPGGARWSHEIRPGTLLIRGVIDYSIYGLHAARILSERLAVSTVQNLCTLIGEPTLAARCVMPGNAAPYWRTYLKYIAHTVNFHGALLELQFPDTILQRSIVTASPSAEAHHLRELDIAMRTAVNARHLHHRVRDLIETSDGAIRSLEEVAQTLQLNVRSIRRNLSSEGYSYRQLVRDVKLFRAESLLQDKNVSVSEVALTVGFDNASNFRKAFLAWKGVSPTEWRKKMLAEKPSPTTVA